MGFITEMIRHMGIISLTSERTWNPTGKLLTKLEDNVYPSELTLVLEDGLGKK